jgi:Tfp pilus assembly pilus retraction ATPase PilT
MKLLPQGSRLANSPFRRRHPTSEEIVEEVYRRVQTQQQQQQEGKSKLNSKTVNTSYASTNSSVDRSSMSSQSPESRTDAKIGRSDLSKPKSDSRQKQRSITPFGRRRNNATSEKTSKLDVTQLVAEYTSHNPGLIIVNSPTPRQQSTTFVSVDGEIPAEVNPKDKRSTSPWKGVK